MQEEEEEQEAEEEQEEKEQQQQQKYEQRKKWGQLHIHGAQWQVPCICRRITAAETDARPCLATANYAMRTATTFSKGHTRRLYSNVKLCFITFSGNARKCFKIWNVHLQNMFDVWTKCDPERGRN